MDIGSLNQRVTFLQQLAGRDAAGQPILSWEPMVTVFANVRYPTGLESVQGGALVARTRASVRIRHRTGITSKLRVLIAGREFQVRAVLPDSTGRISLDCDCEALE